MAVDPNAIETLDLKPTAGGAWIPRAIALGIFLAILYVAAPDMGTTGGFVDPTSLLIVTAGTFALGLISFTPAQLTTTMRCLVQPNGQRSCGERRLAAGVFRMLAAYAIGTGAVGTLFGLVVMLENLNDPSTLGPGMAGALLSSLYASVFAILLMAAGTVASSSNDWTVTIASRTTRPVGAAAGAAAAAVGVALLCFMVLLWSMQAPV
jgi:hypothetical protein